MLIYAFVILKYILNGLLYITLRIVEAEDDEDELYPGIDLFLIECISAFSFFFFKTVFVV